jgi:hypothetical protein
MPLSSIAFVLLILSISFLGTSPAVAQPAVAQPAIAQPAIAPLRGLDTDKIDVRAFAILFRRENAYLKIAQAASSPDDPRYAQKKVIPSLFQLDSVDTANLEQIAAQWEQEVKPVRAQLNAAISSFHETFPNGQLNPDVDHRPPASLLALRAEIDAITLRYRDRFRNSLRRYRHIV